MKKTRMSSKSVAKIKGGARVVSVAERPFDREAAIRRYVTLKESPLRKRTMVESLAAVILGGSVVTVRYNTMGSGLHGDMEALGLDMRNAIAAYERDREQLQAK